MASLPFGSMSTYPGKGEKRREGVGTVRWSEEGRSQQ